jgi:UDP-N-acetyl-D-galactosamine dehydrogenase
MERIAVVGLGYVGLPLALALARKFPNVVGYDVDAAKVLEIMRGHDRTGEIPLEELAGTTLKLTADFTEIADATFYIVAVPTPVDDDKNPDLKPLISASEAVAFGLKKGDVVVYESTVFPGVTEDICGPILADVSKLPRSDFKLGYSPERINPGDTEHTLERVTKVVSGEDAETLERVAAVYSEVTDVHKAPTIRVAEAAKIIENIQRDVNIALVNEFAKLFGKVGINTKDVLAAAATKWNFLDFKPGLVGGHCVGVDPYYLMMLGDNVGEPMRLVSLARRVNEHMPKHVAERTIAALRASRRGFYAGSKVALLGYTFKENVSDTRNSKIPDLAKALRARKCKVMVHDPMAEKAFDRETCLTYFKHSKEPCYSLSDMVPVDAVVFAVPHSWYTDVPEQTLNEMVAPDGVVVDLKGVLDRSKLRSDIILVTI